MSPARAASHGPALMWAAVAGLLTVLTGSVMKLLASSLGSMETMFLRYALGSLILLPWMLHQSRAAIRPRNTAANFKAGFAMALALLVWFMALPYVSIADTTAIAFMSPIVIMLGAAWMLGERLRWDRMVAALVCLAGVIIVVLPKVTDNGNWWLLVMLASSPLFAVAYLMAKDLTRLERPDTIVLWQGISVAIYSLPLALIAWKQPALVQWGLAALSGVLGTGANYCLTKAYAMADISAAQSVRFIDLIWSSILSWLVFGDIISQSTLAGGVIICMSTFWIVARESRSTRASV